jgi:hypothetical protein
MGRETRGPSGRKTGQTLRALVGPVLGSMAASVAGLCVTRRLVPFAILEASNDVVGNYLQTVGSIYAVLLAFVTFVVWTQFNEARGFVEQESNELLDLYRTARGLPQPTRAQVHQLAREYVHVVLASEWEAMACAGPAAAGAGAPIIDKMWGAVHEMEPQVEGDSSVYREVLRRLDDISDLRSSRLGSSRARMPAALRVLLYSGAVTMVGSMYLFAVRSFTIHALITAALAGAISHVLFVIEDLDSCFQGHWQVPRDAFARVQAQIDGGDVAGAATMRAVV